MRRIVFVLFVDPEGRHPEIRNSIDIDQIRGNFPEGIEVMKGYTTRSKGLSLLKTLPYTLDEGDALVAVAIIHHTPSAEDEIDLNEVCQSPSFVRLGNPEVAYRRSNFGQANTVSNGLAALVSEIEAGLRRSEEPASHPSARADRGPAQRVRHVEGSNYLN